jgi:glycosyltransferase involved in cell wall biosynthesis
MTRICIVTTRHISYNPRVLKEADALAAAGYEVAVVAVSNSEQQAAFDEELMRRRSWRLRTVKFRKEKKGERSYWIYLSLRQRFFVYLSAISYRGGVAERAAEKAFDPLKALATAEKAELYIAHHAEALGAACSAARRNKAKFGFDAEDFHTGMNESGQETAQDKLVEFLEAKYLPRLSYMTAASTGIGEAYEKKYGVKRPVTILNVFPYEELPAENVGDPVKFYWYSQVIGPNRGIELLLDAASRIRLPFEIHLRGSLQSEAYRDKLRELCGDTGLWDRLVLHDPILADRLIGEANGYDVGLALESDISFNRNICVTNKTFAYLMSRLVLLGTDTEGQKDIFRHFPDAARIFRMNNAAELAEGMEFYILHREQLLAGKKAAAMVARNTFNWERESEKLLGYIHKILCEPS